MPHQRRAGPPSQRRVEVHYFRKPPRSEVESSRTQTLTLPEVDVVRVQQPSSGSPQAASKRTRRGNARRTTTPTEIVHPVVEEPAPSTRPRRQMSPDQVAEMSLFGHKLFETGRLEEARIVFEGLVGLEVREAFPYTMLGTIYLALEDLERALALFEAALRVDQNDLAALVYRGEIRVARGEHRTAGEDLRRAIGLGLSDDPFVDRAHRLLKMVQEMARTGPR